MVVISVPCAASTGAVALITAFTSGVSLAAASADGMAVLFDWFVRGWGWGSLLACLWLLLLLACAVQLKGARPVCFRVDGGGAVCVSAWLGCKWAWERWLRCALLATTHGKKGKGGVPSSVR